MRVLLGRDCRTFLIWTARSVRLSIAENENEPPWDYSHSQIHKHTNSQKEVTLTDTGYQVMEDFFREEGVIQASKVKLEHTSNWVHVMVILVPCERVLTYTGWEEEGPWDTTDNNALDKHNRGEMLVFPAGQCYLSQKHSWCHWLPLVSLTLWRFPHAADLHTYTTAHKSISIPLFKFRDSQIWN